MKRINYNKIRRLLLADLQNIPHPNRVRRLDPSDVALAIQTLKRLRRRFPKAEAWIVSVYGGLVPRSYRYQASADVLSLRVDADGVSYCYVDRHIAPIAPYGRGDLCKRWVIVGGKRVYIRQL